MTKFWVLVIFLTEQMIFFDKLLICIFLRRKCQALKPYSMLPGGGFSPYGVDMFSGGVPGSGLPSPAAYANSHASQFSVSNNPSVQQFWVNIYKLLFQKPWILFENLIFIYSFRTLMVSNQTWVVWISPPDLMERIPDSMPQHQWPQHIPISHHRYVSSHVDENWSI